MGSPPLVVKQLSRHSLEQILALSSQGIVVTDACNPDLPIVYANPAYEKLTGYSADEVIGQGWRLLGPDAQEQPLLRELKAAMGRSESCEIVFPDIRKDGTTWSSRISVHPLTNKRGDLEYYLCSQVAATADRGSQGDGLEVGLLQRELRRARQKIASLDRLEPATGVFRYEYFMELARRDFFMAKRDKRAVSVMLLEVNDLDIYGQTFGRKAVDSCLRMVAAQITSSLRRSGDLCARAADTRLVALVHGQDVDDARSLALRIAKNVRGLGLHNPRGSSGRYITVRVGVAGAQQADDDPETVIGRAMDDLGVTEPRSAAAQR